eukprot:GEMP01048690.1.p1 GENE.GEMP01048690.1~~GEMP01048690.1.p1  ORF type:complete len:355 (+),score=77.77 GEMP01048690.1:25-1089(+)
MLSIFFLLSLVVTRDKLYFVNGTFKIMMFCDMHYGEKESHDVKSSKFQRAMIRLEKPDLIIIDGDAISNYAAPPCDDEGKACMDFYTKNWQNFTAPIIDAEVPYVYTLGNHDRIHFKNGTVAVPGHFIMQYDRHGTEYSLSEDGPADIHGASNFVIPIYAAEKNSTVTFYLWMMDSNENNCEGVKGWGCVELDQVQWFLNKSRELKEKDGRVIPGIMFHHIPMVEAGNIQGVFHGHDHNNDFIAEFLGVKIGFGRKSGYGGYGGRIADKPGSRMLDLSLDAQGAVSWDTYLRLDSGERVTQVPLVSRPSQAACCGMDTTSETSLPVDRCRKLDDRAGCREAAGMDVKDELVVFE